MELDRRIVSTEHILNVKKKDLMNILKLDIENILEAGVTLHGILKQIVGIKEVDYDASFGPYIYMTVENEHDCAETWDQVVYKIQQYLDRSKN